jgi:hypothetical protein
MKRSAGFFLFLLALPLGAQSAQSAADPLLYVFSDGPVQPLKAIYFDNEGHVIHYKVSTPDAGTAVFLSDGSQPGPAFQLVYQSKDAAMLGRFQMRMPGQTEWKSYLEWSGAKQRDK